MNEYVVTFKATDFLSARLVEQVVRVSLEDVGFVLTEFIDPKEEEA